MVEEIKTFQSSGEIEENMDCGNLIAVIVIEIINLIIEVDDFSDWNTVLCAFPLL